MSDEEKKKILLDIKAKAKNQFEFLEGIEIINNPEITKYCIENFEDFDILKDETIPLIATLKDPDKKKYLDDENLYFNSIQMEKIIKLIKDESILKDIVEESDFYQLKQTEVVDIITQKIKDEEFTKEWTSKFEIQKSNQEDVSFFRPAGKKLTMFHKRYFESNIYNLLLHVQDKEYIKSWIDKMAPLKLSDTMKLQLIELVNDPKYYKECLENLEKLNLNLPEIIELKMLYLSNDRNAREKYIKEDELYNPEEKIVLPKGMTAGIEIESEGDKSRYIKYFDPIVMGSGEPKSPEEYMERYVNKNSAWTATGDGSLNNGVEVVSPIIGDSDNAYLQPEEASDEIKLITKFLRDQGQYISDSCGGHVHIGAEYLKDVDAWKNLIEIWSNAEKIIYLMSNRAGELPRFGAIGDSINPGYARPISTKIEEAIRDKEITLTNKSDLFAFTQELMCLQENRYYGLNFQSIMKHQTIEFRLPNGSLYSSAWIDNINLFGGIVRSSQELSDIMKKTPEEMTKEDLLKLEALDNLKNPDIPEDKKAKSLIFLAIPEELGKNFITRYDVNSKLLNLGKKRSAKAKYIGRALTEQTPEKPVEVSDTKEKILAGKKILNEIFNKIPPEKILEEIDGDTLNLTLKELREKVEQKEQKGQKEQSFEK